MQRAHPVELPVELSYLLRLIHAILVRGVQGAELRRSSQHLTHNGSKLSITINRATVNAKTTQQNPANCLCHHSHTRLSATNSCGNYCMTERKERPAYCHTCLAQHLSYKKKEAKITHTPVWGKTTKQPLNSLLTISVRVHRAYHTYLRHVLHLRGVAQHVVVPSVAVVHDVLLPVLLRSGVPHGHDGCRTSTHKQDRTGLKRDSDLQIPR